VAILDLLSKFWDLDFCVANSHAEWNATEELVPYIEKLEAMGIRVYRPSKDAFSRAVNENQYAGGYFNLYWIAEEMMPLFKSAQPGAFTIVDSVDVHFAREATQAKLGAIEMSKVMQTKKRELGVYKAADVAIAVSKDDLHLLTVTEGLKNIFLIPNIVREFPRTVGKRKPVVVFIGSYAWYPNPEAVIWFTELIWPAIYKSTPEAEFLIIGSDPTPEILALGTVPGVKVLGYVPETKPYLEMAAVSVAPLRVGGGMKGKVNEAMAHGIPVVATKIGAQGFEAVHGKQMMITDDPDEFAECVTALISNDALQQEMGLAGQKLNSAICSYQAVNEKIRDLVIHCNSLITTIPIVPAVNSPVPESTKLSFFIKDFGYALQLLKRDGLREFFKRMWLYLHGQRLPVGTNDQEKKKKEITRIEKATEPPQFFETTNPSFASIEFPKISETPTVSIIIPVYNQWDFTYACLDSILKNTGGISYEIILADDNSTDETKFVEQSVKNIHVVRNEMNLGFLFNCNNAAKFAKGKFLIFLNNDTLVQPEWLNWLLKTMADNADVGMAGSKFMFSTGELQEAGGIVFTDGSATNYGRYDWPNVSHNNYLKDVDYCSGACICVRHELWLKVGGFDPIYSPGYYEDTDLAMKIRSIGYRTVYQPKSVIIHFEGVSHGSDLTTGIKSKQTENQHIFLKKWKNELEKNNYARYENLFRARDKSKHKHVVLLIDYCVPTCSSQIDKQKYFHILNSLLEKRMKVIILPDNFYKTEPEVSDLEQKGIEVLYGGWYRENWWLWFTENFVNINTIIFIDKPIADKYIPMIKTIPSAKFNIEVIRQGVEFDIRNIL
jgi:GT2 family glycosyltransferase/glycosyltransferase involved in cell wall biosynthesis